MPHRVKLTIEINAKSEADAVEQIGKVMFRLNAHGGVRSVFGVGAINGSS